MCAIRQLTKLYSDVSYLLVSAKPSRQQPSVPAVPNGTPTTTVNKMCGSGMRAVMMAADALRTGEIDIAVAGGLESMTNAPYILPKARAGYRMGHGEILDHMFCDGLQSPWDGQLIRVLR
jgi:acetyl-CoA C-acetyltransferase